MQVGNVIKTLDFVGHGWDMSLTIRAADEQAYQEARLYLCDMLQGGAAKASRQFLDHLQETKGTNI